MNKIYLGFSKQVHRPHSGFLFIDDDVPTLDDWKRPQVFDPLKHSFNPLHNIDYKTARALAEVLYTVAPQGEQTLTVRNGKRSLLKALLRSKSFDDVEGDDEVRGLIDDLLVSPVLKRVLCSKNTFTFKPTSMTFARLNRAELGEFDALVLGLLLIGHYKGQLVVPDLGFYGRNIHTNLIREGRLISGVYHLDELPEKLRNLAVLVPAKVLSGATYEDAQLCAKLAGKLPGTNDYNDFVAAAVA